MHCVQAGRDDIRILKAKDAAVAHCPKSNAKLGCGVAPLADLLRQGVRVGFGTDSPASSNIMDMFDEMRTALFLHRAVERDVSVLDAPKCVRIATLGGAEALGMDDRVGSLEPGKHADLIAVDVSSSHFAPIDDPYSALVYGANQDDVLFTVRRRRGALPGPRRTRDLDAEAIRAESRRGAREAARPRARRRRAGRRRRIGLVARPAATDQRGELMLLDRQRVKFWQKWIFGFMAVLMAGFLIFGSLGRGLGLSRRQPHQLRQQRRRQQVKAAVTALKAERQRSDGPGSPRPRPTRLRGNGRTAGSAARRPTTSPRPLGRYDR